MVCKTIVAQTKIQENDSIIKFNKESKSNIFVYTLPTSFVRDFGLGLDFNFKTNHTLGIYIARVHSQPLFMEHLALQISDKPMYSPTFNGTRWSLNYKKTIDELWFFCFTLTYKNLWGNNIYQAYGSLKEDASYFRSIRYSGIINVGQFQLLGGKYIPSKYFDFEFSGGLGLRYSYSKIFVIQWQNKLGTEFIPVGKTKTVHLLMPVLSLNLAIGKRVRFYK